MGSARLPPPSDPDTHHTLTHLHLLHILSIQRSSTQFCNIFQFLLITTILVYNFPSHDKGNRHFPEKALPQFRKPENGERGTNIRLFSTLLKVGRDMDELGILPTTQRESHLKFVCIFVNFLQHAFMSEVDPEWSVREH